MDSFYCAYSVESEEIKLFGLILFIGVAVGLFFFVRRKRKKKLSILTFKFFLLVGALMFSLYLGYYEIYNFIITKRLFKNEKYQRVEGYVKNFVPMPFGGHQAESFEVEGIKFQYSDYDDSDYGFTRTKSHGGPIDSGKYVRISYIRDARMENNIIIKLEIRK
jgi:hypothetical protein